MKILVVDDKKENLDAAREGAAEVLYYSEHTFEYASSEKEAIRAINMAFESDEPFQIVITDLEMEDPNSGLKVAEETFACLAIPYIATGKTGYGEGAHALETLIKPINYLKNTSKKYRQTWFCVFQRILFDYNNDQTELVSAFGRWGRYRLDKEFVNGLMEKFL